MLNEPTKEDCENAIRVLKESIKDNVPDIVILDSWFCRKNTTGVIKLQYDPYPRYEENAKKVINWFRSNVSSALFNEMKKVFTEEK